MTAECPLMPCNGLKSCRDVIAVELANNDACGIGPVSETEYRMDAESILRIVCEALLSEEAIERAAEELHDRQCSGRTPYRHRPDFHKQMHRDDAREVITAALQEETP